MNAHDPIAAARLPADPDGTAIREAFLADERMTVAALAAQAAIDTALAAQVAQQARVWVEGVRVRAETHKGVESFLAQYDLSTQEGVLLMCVAEALLRIPDAPTADALIRDKLARGDWERHLGASDSLLVNASTWGLMLTGRLTRIDTADAHDPAAWYQRIVARAGEPVVRVAVRQAMKVMAEQFVMGRTIGEALARARSADAARVRHSFDMLGEAALTARDAARYQDSYAAAIRAIGQSRADTTADVVVQPSISVKLSALHPRYELAQRERVMSELVPRLVELAALARERGIGMTIDAEESDRLEISLEILARLRRDAALADWDGLGLAVQAYQKRARAVVAWVAALARDTHVRIPVRLVKGAYWDTEVKRAQVQGLANYPVFTRKAHTDVSYLACARALLDATPRIYPMFATHNAHTIAFVAALAHQRGHDFSAFEFQRLHGMGEALYAQVIGPSSRLACRVYAPVGSHQDLLPYLVRRLLENGANTSFVNRIADPAVSVDDVIADPVARARAHDYAPAGNLPLPRDLFAPERENSAGVSLADQDAMASIDAALSAEADPSWVAAPMLARSTASGTARAVFDPSDLRRRIGTVVDADAATVERAVETLQAGQPAWDARGAARAVALDGAAAVLERERNRLVCLLTREAGKTRPAAIAEVREAVDFCRYYASLARTHFARPLVLPSPTGEANTLSLHGRGVFACISPWNFPLAIFTGQVAAALAAGNAVAAKPAEQTPLTAAYATQCLLEGGVPADALALLPGDGETVGAALVSHPRIAGVAFTGSTAVASLIARTLAARTPIVPLVAETGGQNAMVVDSSALPEQVVQDAVVSAFDSAGQRCSALRVLCLQEDIASRVMELLAGAMDELVIGDPALLATDVGPVIDESAREALEAHIATMQAAGLVRHRTAPPAAALHGTFVAPTLIELDALTRLRGEVFGPVLHVYRYRAGDLDALVDAINAYGYGLTLGIHSRIDATVERIVARARVGNLYVNRNMIGAVVGVQPFGGEGLSGHRPQGRRAALPVPLRGRALAVDQHGRRRRQRGASRTGRGRLKGRRGPSPAIRPPSIDTPRRRAYGPGGERRRSLRDPARRRDHLREQGMSTLSKLIVAVLVLACGPSFGAVTTSVVDVPTRGVTVRTLGLLPDAPKASIIAWPGGDGFLDIQDNGAMPTTAGKCFPVARIRQMLADQGYAVTLVDLASDGRVYNQTDMLAIARYVRARDHLPVWIIGGSSSAPPTVNLAGMLPSDLPAGAVIFSPDPVPTAWAALVARPTLVVFHQLDQAAQSGAALYAALTAAQVKQEVVVTGGTNTGCGFHLFEGRDAVFQAAVTSFIDANNGSLGNGPSPFAIHQHGITGSWYDPATGGQGIELEVFPNLIAAGTGLVQGSWFTFDHVASGGADHGRWYTFGGNVQDGRASATLPLYQNVGGNFNALPVTNAVTVGSVTLTLTDCTTAALDYTFSDGSSRSGTIPLTRLTANVTCTPAGGGPGNADFGLSGNWFDAARSGQGFVFEVNPANPVFFMTWYTYAPNGAASGAAGQRWYTGQRPTRPAHARQPFLLYETTGGRSTLRRPRRRPRRSAPAP